MNCRNIGKKPLERGWYLLFSVFMGIAAGHCGSAVSQGDVSGPAPGDGRDVLTSGSIDAAGDRIEDLVFDDESLASRIVNCDDPGEKPAGIPCAPSRLLCELRGDRYRPCDELYMGDLLPVLRKEPADGSPGPLPMLPILLYQMKEPPLYTRNRAERVEAYRVTMETWAFVDIIRIERSGESGPGLAVRKLAERGPHNLWIHTRQITTIKEERWQAVRNLFATMDFWEGDRHRRRDIGKDGAMIYLEGVGKNGYQSVARGAPSDFNETDQLVDFLHRFFQERPTEQSSQVASDQTGY